MRLLATGETRPRQAHPDRHRRRAASRRRDRRPRARHLVERSVPSEGTAEAHPDPGRRLYRGRVRRHLHRPRLRGDAGLSRREDPARLRRRRARASARRDGASAASRSSRGRPSTAVEKVDHGLCVELSGQRIDRGRPGDVRHRPQAERHRARAGEGRRRARRERRRSRSTNIRRPRCRTSTRSATSPTGSTSRRSRSARAMPSPTRVFGGKPTRGRSRRRADRGVLRAGSRRRRPDRDAGRASSLREVDIYKTTFRPMKATLAGRDTRSFFKLVVDGDDRPRARLPHRRARRRRDDPAGRHRREDEAPPRPISTPPWRCTRPRPRNSSRMREKAYELRARRPRNEPVAPAICCWPSPRLQSCITGPKFDRPTSGLA